MIRNEELKLRYDKVLFFVKQKTAYEVLRSLVGSEMCIRDSRQPRHRCHPGQGRDPEGLHRRAPAHQRRKDCGGAVSYTHLTLPTIYSV